MVKHIPVFFEGQDDLIDILATSMCSICYNTKSFIDFYILDCGIHKFNKKQLETLKEKFNNFSIKYIPIDLKQFNGLQGYRKGFVDCYSRLLIPELVKDIDKAIYLDTDTIAIDDIKKLWEEDLGEYELGAVSDIGFTKSLHDNAIKNLDVSIDHIILNAGMLLIDCKKWRKNNTSNNLLKIAKKYNNSFIAIDEEILSNYYSTNNYKRLDNRYNLSDRANELGKVFSEIKDSYLKNEWNSVVVQHFSPDKPWLTSINSFSKDTIKNFNSFWFFAKMTPFYFGMSNRYNQNVASIASSNTFSNKNKKIYKLFNFIPLLKIEIKNNNKIYKLFGFIPLLKIKG